MGYRVTAGHVNIEVGGQATRFNCGTVLSEGADPGQIDWELNLGTIELFDGPTTGAPGTPVPAGMSVSATLKWAASNPVRAKAALDLETGKDSPNATLVDRLQAIVVEGGSADSGTGASVDS